MVTAGHGPVHPFFHRQSEAFQPVLRVRQRVTRRRGLPHGSKQYCLQTPEPAVQLSHCSRSGGHSTRRGPWTSALTTMLRGPAHSARDASSGTCAPIVGVATVPSLAPRSHSRGGCSEPDSESVASCRL